jgi:23S rRNA (uracil1939-C5)-methyltransferase
VEVEIEKLVYGGDGLARMDGQVILTPFVLPAERIKITTEKIKNGLLRGVGPEIIRSSPERVVPICEYFADCGGCHYQQSNYEFQLASKRAILNETLQRIGGISYQDEIATISGHPWNYRNRIQLHFQNRKCGFHRVGSHDVRPIARCYISSPVLNDVIQELQGAVTQPQWPEFLRTLEVFTDESAIELNIVDSTKPVAARFFEWCGSFLPKLADKAIEYRAGEFTYRVSRGSFFQVNRFPDRGARQGGCGQQKRQACLRPIRRSRIVFASPSRSV